MAPCDVCAENEHKYTCPRCKTRTCSAPCAKAHKDATGCSGERDKAAYVPMNQYTWGSLMDDYTFLEDIGRKAADWGSTIVRNGYLAQTQRGRGGARGDARRTAATRSDGRRAFLRTQLELCDIDLELLPDGMTRRKLNQSFWDSRTKTAMLTLELVLHPPNDTLALATNPPPPVTIISHRNDISRPLVDIVRSTLNEREKRKGNDPLPDWAAGLVENRADLTTLYLIAHTDLGPTSKVTSYRKLDATIKLAKSLRNAPIVEFPTIHIWDADAFDGQLVDAPIITEVQPPAKRRKLNPSAGKSNMLALVGDYASDEDEDKDEDVEEQPDADVTTAVGEYGSDQDVEHDQDEDEPLDLGEGADEAEGELGGEDEEMDESLLLAAGALLVQRQLEEEEEELDSLLSDSSV